LESSRFEEARAKAERALASQKEKGTNAKKQFEDFTTQLGNYKAALSKLKGADRTKQ